MNLLKTISKISFIFFILNSYSMQEIKSNGLHKDVTKRYYLTLNQKPQSSFISEALKKSGPAVVTIETQTKILAKEYNLFNNGLMFDPYFDQFFKIPRLNKTTQRIERGQGSGVIFSTNGLVLTNAHVVEKTDKVVVGLTDGRRVNAKVIGLDTITDIAVIKLDDSDSWPTAILGDSDTLSVGDWAIAVGNPYGLENTVTLGIISNLNRNVSQLGISDKRVNLIQTDAAINPGNSGGPLLNSKGEVIGINTLVRSGPGAGLGFAIPINKVKEISNQLIKSGKAIHPMIGINLSSIPPELNNTINNGAYIVYVIPEGPASKAGLKSKDIIISINKKAISSPQDVINEINKNGINKSLRITFLRSKDIKSILVKPIDINKILL